MKKNKSKIIISTAVSTFLSIALFTSMSVFLTSCSCSNFEKEQLEKNQFDIKNSVLDFSSIGSLVYEDIGTKPRQIQTQTYESEIEKKLNGYHLMPGKNNNYEGISFKYPGFDYNYETISYDQENKHTKPSSNYAAKVLFQNAEGNQIDAYPLVAKETVYDYLLSNKLKQWLSSQENKNLYFSSPRFILDQIENNQFKKHKASENFLDFNFNKINETVTRKFNISTGFLGPTPLGLYAPAGEVVTITFDDKTFELMKRTKFSGIRFVFNGNLWENKNIDSPDSGCTNSGRISNRYPRVRSSFQVGVNPNDSNSDLVVIDETTKSIKIGTPFGGGLQINIENSLKPEYSNSSNKTTSPISFIVDGCIPTIFYQYGVTTNEQWEKQKEDVSNEKIAPILQATTAYFSLTVTPEISLYDNETKKRNVRYGGFFLSKMSFPENNFKKWNDFLFLSNYFAGNDLNGKLKKLNMEICNDIWGNASAWGGGMSLYVEPNWIIDPLFYGDPLTTFSVGYSWGLLHEINHNFQQNAFLFNKRGHGETNQVSIFNLSVLSDIGRLRSEANLTGEKEYHLENSAWDRLENYFRLVTNLRYKIDKIRKTQMTNSRDDEYTIYALINYFLGPKFYADFCRYDVRKDGVSNNDISWTGFQEIYEMSKIFKLNFWPALFQYGKDYWADNWPISESEITPEQKQKIKELEQYPAIDFVSNLYASGTYLYNSAKQEYIYGGDTIAPFEIPSGRKKVINLEKWTTSANPEFKFNKFIVPKKSKLGIELKYNEQTKEITYIPSVSKLAEVDEFDIDVIPGEFINKAKNYVPSYRFKIKLRQTPSRPLMELYNIPFEKRGNWDWISNYLKNTNDEPYDSYLGTEIFQIQKNALHPFGARLKFNFVAPKDGFYEFKSKFDDIVRVYENEKEVFRRDEWTGEYLNIWSKQLKKGDVVPLTIIYSEIGSNDPNIKSIAEFRLKTYVDNKEFNLNDNVLLWNYKDIFNNLKISEIMSHKARRREIDFTLFNSSLSKFFNETSYPYDIMDPKKFKCVGVTPKNQKVSENGNVETWNKDYIINGIGHPILEMDINFEKPTDVAGLIINHRVNNWYWKECRPSYVKIVSIDENNQETILFETESYPNRTSASSIINFNKKVNTKKIRLTLINKDDNNQGVISLDSVSCLPEKIISLSNTFSLTNMKRSKKWHIATNSFENISSINNSYLWTDKKEEYIEFVLKNANSFALVGQKNNIGSSIKIIVNDKEYFVDLNSDKTEFNQILFKWNQSDDKTPIKVKIINNSNKKIYLNYILTTGNNTIIG